MSDPQSPLPPPGSPIQPTVASKKAWWKRWWAITIAAVVVLVVIVNIASDESDDESNSSTEAPADVDGSDDAGAETETDPPAGKADDVGACSVLSESTIIFEVTNNSSKQSSYIIDVNFLNDAGERVGDESVIVNHLRPDETALEEQFVFDTSGGTACEIAKVDRMAAESPNDVSEVTCEVTGVDVLSSIETSLVATNGSSKRSDYSINVALTRDGVRVGTAIATINNVEPGESAPGEGLTTTDGPAEGTTCETVHVSRSATSE